MASDNDNYASERDFLVARAAEIIERDYPLSLYREMAIKSDGNPILGCRFIIRIKEVA